MSIVKPQTITNQLFERLEIMFASGHQPSHFELLRLEKEALALSKVDAAGASLIRAGLAAVQWDVERARYFVVNACSLARTPATYMNGALTFKFLNEMATAAVYARDALRMAVNDREYVSGTVGYLTMAGDLSGAKKILQEHQKMSLNLDQLTQEVFQFSLAMDELDVSSDRLSFELDKAFKVLSKHRIRASEVIMSKDVDPDGGYGLAVGINFVGDLALEMRLEAELAEQLIQEPGWNPCVLSVEFKYKSKNALQLA